MALAYNVYTKAEVEPLLMRAAASGATILKPAREAAWGGYSGYFADPDGFAWEVAWNPSWRLTPEGRIFLFEDSTPDHAAQETFSASLDSR